MIKWVNFFSKITSWLISPGNHCTTLFIDLTLGEHLEILGERRVGMHKSGIWDTKPAIFLKRRSLMSIVSVETRVWPIGLWQIWWPRVNFGLLFRGANFSTMDISTLFVGAQGNLAALGVWSIETHSPNFVNFGPGSRDTMRRHASVLHRCTCKVVFRQLSMFVDSFSVISIHCVARGLGASFLYKCFASRGNFPATARPSC